VRGISAENRVVAARRPDVETDGRRRADRTEPTVTSSLSDRPGTAGDRPRHTIRRGRRKGRGRSPWRSGRLDFAPRPLAFEDRDAAGPTVFREQRKRVELGTILAGLFALGTAALVAVLVYRGTRVDVDQTGIDDGAVLNGLEAAALEVKLVFDSAEVAGSAALSFDGEAVEDPTVAGDTMVWRPPAELAEGEHRLALSVPRMVIADAKLTWRFTVDLRPPTLEVPAVAEPVAIDEATAVSGTAEPGTTVTAGGDKVEVEADGTFRLDYTRPPAGPVPIVAVDEAGNRTTSSVVFGVTYPSLRGVHVSAAAWSNEQLRTGILRLVDEGRIDTVQLDLKDDDGVVGYDTSVERARQIGAVTQHYDLDEAVKTIEDHGARVVGRIVAFRDPILAQAAWAAGRTDQVIQSATGGPYDAPGEFTNFADVDVRRYNLDIAVEAVDRGVDDILWDETRRPNDDPASMVIPGLSGSATDAVAGFLAEAHSELRRRGAYQGVTVVGEAAERGDLYGQDVARIARNADYVAPEIYPGYWTSGRYGVANPSTQPGELVRGLLGHFQKVTKGSGTALAPWLQGFGVNGVSYGDAEVRAQIDAARAVGVERFILWDPSVSYSAGALTPP
jgi:hypothetical protein